MKLDDKSIEDEGLEYEDLTFLIKRKSFNHTKDMFVLVPISQEISIINIQIFRRENLKVKTLKKTIKGSHDNMIMF